MLLVQEKGDFFKCNVIYFEVILFFFVSSYLPKHVYDICPIKLTLGVAYML